MSDELWKYAQKLNEKGDPDDPEVRGLVQENEQKEDFQDVVGRLNNLHRFQQEKFTDHERKVKRRSELE